MYSMVCSERSNDSTDILSNKRKRFTNMRDQNKKKIVCTRNMDKCLEFPELYFFILLENLIVFDIIAKNICNVSKMKHYKCTQRDQK